MFTKIDWSNSNVVLAHNDLVNEVSKSSKISKNLKKIWLDHPANLYLTQYQANIYLELMNDTNYHGAFHDPVKYMFLKYREQILAELIQPIDIIDLGPGFPDKTIPILQLLIEKKMVGRYIPVDISTTFLQVAEKAVLSLDIPVIPINCLFEDLPDKLNTNDFISSPSRLVILGLTFMNYRPIKIIPLLSSLIRNSDTVIVATELIDQHNKDELIKPYYSDHAKALNSAVIELLKIPSKSTKYFVKLLKNRLEMGFKFTENVKLNNGCIILKGNTVVTAVSHRYLLSEFKKHLNTCFPYTEVFTDPNGYVAIAKCRLSK